MNIARVEIVTVPWRKLGQTFGIILGSMEIIKLGIFACPAAFILPNSCALNRRLVSLSSRSIYISNCLQISVRCGPLEIWYFIGREGILRKNVYDTTSREVEVLCVLGILVKVIYARFIRIFFLAENIFGVILLRASYTLNKNLYKYIKLC